MLPPKALILTVSAIFLSAWPARADMVAIASTDPAGKPTVYTDVKVVDIALGKIVFTTSAGNRVVKDFSSVADLTLDDEPILADAQRDFSANRVEKATDEFEQVISKTEKPWLKAYIMPRFTQAADKAGRFDKAVTGYIYLVQHDWPDAEKYRPGIPQFGSGYLDPAANTLRTATDDPSVKPAQQTALLALLLDVHRARKDNKSMDAVARRLSGNPAAGDPISDVAAGALADARLADARAALAQKQFDQAAGIINGAKQLFTDPSRQADALFILAQAAGGQADAKKDPGAARDAALGDAVIAYLRVVADFRTLPGAPHVADSLLGAAVVLEKLNQPAKALQTYQSVTADFPGSPQAEEARKQVDRLQAAGVKN